MQVNKKYLIPAALFFCIAIGLVSAKVLLNARNKPVNIFEGTTNECAGLIWITPFDSSNRVSPLTVSGELFFAGEKVPLQDPEVRERLERELQLNTYWHSNTLMCMKSANRYFDEIEKLLEANGLPTDFKYLPLIESNFRNEVSPAGAAGFWQLVKPTAKSYGLEINDEVDERYNIERATAAACKYLKEAKEKFGTWTLAAASYNLGMSSMTQRISDQKSSNFYDMYFNQETSRYIFRMLAMKIIFSDPKRAGFYLKPEDLYQPFKYKTVEIDSGITSIADFAAQYNLKYKHIKVLNTWLREAQLTNKDRRKYQIRVAE